MQKRGQAAMEFLMTYGWAILAAIIVIAVLAIYFRPGNLVGQVSVLNPPFTALSQSITASSEVVDIEIKNNGAEALTIQSGNVTATVNSPTGADCTPVLSTTVGGSTVTYPYQWAAATTAYVRCDLNADGDTDDLVEGRSFDANLQIIYTSGSGTIPKISTGSISGRINA